MRSFSEKNSSGLRNIFSRLSAPLLDQILVSGGNFFTIALCARLLPMADQGKLGYVFSAYLAVIVLNMTSIFQWASIQAPIEKDKAAYRSNLAELQMVLALLFTAAMTAIIAFVGITSGWSPTFGEVALIAGFLFFQQVADFDRRSAYIFVTASRAAKSSSLIFPLRIALLAYFRPETMAGVLLILVLTSIGPFCITAYFGAKGGIRLSETFRFVKKEFGGSKWLVASGPLVWLWASIPVFLLGWVLSLEMVGAFVTVRSLANIANIFMELLETDVSAKAGRLFTTDRAGFDSFFKKIRLAGTVFWSAGFIFIAFFGGRFLNAIFGSAYSAFALLLLIFWIANGIVFYFRLNAVILRTTDRSWVVTFGYGASVVAMLFASYPAIAFMGVAGGAVLVCVGASANYLVQAFFDSRLARSQGVL